VSGSRRADRRPRAARPAEPKRRYRILLEPIATDLEAWLVELDRSADVPVMEHGRDQPPMLEVEESL